MKQSRCRGVLLAAACGDALGANLEFRTAEEIQRRFGRVRDMGAPGQYPPGVWTDDTQAMMAAAVSLVECNGVSLKHHAQTLVRLWDVPPRKGYGPGTLRILHALREGADPRTTGTLVYPEGSRGNGALMKAIPTGLLHHEAVDEMRAMVEALCWPTHRHPEAMSAALAAAATVAAQVEETRPLADLKEIPLLVQYVEDLHEFAGAHPVVARNLHQLAVVLKEQRPVGDLLSFVCRPWRKLAHFAIDASACLPIALWCFLANLDDPEEAIVTAANLGGDADSVACLTGAFCGACHGADFLPARWLEKLEQRAWITEIADRLADMQ